MDDASEDTVSDDAESPADADEAPRTKYAFHRGEATKFYPRGDDYLSKTFLQDFVLDGWLPAAPFLTPGTRITAFGSCFAANITRHLSALGYNLSADRDPDIYISRLTDGMVNVAAILGQFQWALENKRPEAPLWHGFDAESYGYEEDIRVRTRDTFLSTDFFIITLGLSEIWYDEETGGTFWRAVPEKSYDPKRHKFRVLSVRETRRAIAAIYRLIQRHVPDAKVLFTVSPIPLIATFRDVNCMSANAVSKAVIRAALDELIRSRPDDLNKGLFYFPSMEIVQLAFNDPMGPDGRHPLSYVLDTVMKTFEAAYCVGEGTFEDANALFQMYRLQNMRDIAKRIPGDAEARALEKAARSEARKGRQLRAQVRAAEKEKRSAELSRENAESAD